MRTPKINDFVIYREGFSTEIGVVLHINHEGGTLKVLSDSGKVTWFVTSGCEIISEGR